MDLAGYGLSGRKAAEPYFDMDLWARQVQLGINHVAPSGPVGLIGHSLGGSVVLRAALNNARVNKVLLQGSLGVKFPINEAIEVSWSVPKDAAAFRDFYERVIRVKGNLSDRFIEDRLAICRKDGYDKYFNQMFAGNKQVYLDQTALPPARLADLKADVLLIYGDDDACVPFEGPGLALANAIKQADVVRFANSGHPCSLDVPEKFLKYATCFFG
jgi:2-hydroxymuconate-semialdehyde hydrolase